LPGQRVLRSDLARVTELAGRERVGSPPLLIVGPVAVPVVSGVQRCAMPIVTQESGCGSRRVVSPSMVSR